MTTPATPSVKQLGKPRSDALRDLRERGVLGVLIGFGLITVCITLGIIGILLLQTLHFFDPAGHMDAQGETSVVTLKDFLFDTQWNPLLGGEKHFGILPLIVGTFKIVFVAMVFAIPVGLISAIWLSEYASKRARSIIKPVLEVLAGIPTVVFGFFAVTFITPVLLRWEWLQVQVVDANGNPVYNDAGQAVTTPAGFLGWFDFGTYNALGAGLAVGIMCLPIIISLSEDALRAVPNALREGSLGLGSSKFETSVKVVFPAALSGIVAALLLAIARAVGETMIVALAAGGKPVDMSGVGSTLSLTDPVLPMTGYMVQIFTGDAPHGTVEYYSSYAVAATLFVITLGMTVLGNVVQKRFRQKYQ